MIANVMMSTALANLGVRKIIASWNKGYDVINSAHEVTREVLLRDSNYIVDVVIWPKFGNSSISMREVKNIT